MTVEAAAEVHFLIAGAIQNCETGRSHEATHRLYKAMTSAGVVVLGAVVLGAGWS
jgi:hypothetical protein